MSGDELGEMRERVARLERELAGIKRLLGLTRAGSAPESGEPHWAEVDGVGFVADPGEDVRETARLLRRALGPGELPPPGGPAAS